MKLSSTVIIAIGMLLFVCSVVIGECRQPIKKSIMVDPELEAPVRAYLETLKRKIKE